MAKVSHTTYISENSNDYLASGNITIDNNNNNISREDENNNIVVERKYRYVSRRRDDDPGWVEEVPPYYFLFTTYFSYLVLICFGHLRDFFGKRFRSNDYQHLREQNVSLSL